VEGSHQLAADVSPQAADDLVPLTQQIQRNTGSLPRRVLADDTSAKPTSWPWPPKGSTPSSARTSCGTPTPCRLRGRIPKTLSVRGMRRKLRSRAYNLRKCTVEPVLGQIKAALRQFSFRGLVKVRAEWLLVACAHNLRKLYGPSPAASAGNLTPSPSGALPDVCLTATPRSTVPDATWPRAPKGLPSIEPIWLLAALVRTIFASRGPGGGRAAAGPGLRHPAAPVPPSRPHAPGGRRGSPHVHALPPES
jgi:hypothetical protein